MLGRKTPRMQAEFRTATWMWLSRENPATARFGCFHLQRNTIVLQYNLAGRGQDMDLRDALIDWDDPADEEAVRRQHAANPIRQPPAGAINQQSFAALLSLLAQFKALRESQGLTLAEVAERMGMDAPALSRLETGKMLNPTLATLFKW